MESLIAAISLGFFGSFHCIGMCGPIALALPVHHKNVTAKITAILTYNAGRIITYCIFGLLFGLIGKSFVLFGFQQKLSVFLGIVILLGLLLPQRFVYNYSGLMRVYNALSHLKNAISTQFQRKGLGSFFSIGMLNGLLPCGLVYLAVAGAITSGNALDGILFMAAFGLGTLPFMLSISFTSHLFKTETRHTIRKVMPIVTGVTALLLILRGLNLGIDYISPKLTDSKINSIPHKQINCCHKK